jgi:hypothetical protein
MQNTAARKRKQVPEGYLIIGVDPHKKRHAAVAITQDFTTRDKFKFDNTREGLETMLRRARTEMVKYGCRGVMFAIETGGHTYPIHRPSARREQLANLGWCCQTRRFHL